MKRAFLLFSLAALFSFSLMPLYARIVRIPSYYSYDYSSSDTPGVSALYYENFMRDIADLADWEYDLIDLEGKSPVDALKDGSVDLLYDVVRTSVSNQPGFFWSSTPSGTDYLMLVTDANNSKFNATYISNLSGARIGYNENNEFERQVLDAFIQAHNILAVPVAMDRLSDAHRQMEDGRVDLYISSRTFPSTDEKVIYSFGHYSTYFVSLDSTLIDELNKVRNAMYKKNAMYMENLMARATGSPTLDLANITSEERSYILRTKTLSVIDDDYNMDGSSGEIRRSFWNYVTGVTGLDFQTVKGNGDSAMYQSPCLYDAVVTDKVRNSGVFYTTPYYVMNVRVVCAPNVTVQDLERFHGDNSGDEKLKCVLPPDMQKVLPYFSERFKPYEVTVKHTPADCLDELSKGKYDFALLSDFSLQQRYSINDYKKLRDQEIVVYRIPISIIAKTDQPRLVTSILNKAFSQLPFDYYNNLRHDQGLYLNRVPAQEVVRYRVVNSLFLFFGVFVLYNLIITLWHSRRYRKQVTTDQLTGLLSIAGFESECGKMVNLMPDDKFMLTELNVRDFSFINRLYGPGSGDRILECIARTLTKLCQSKKHCYIARGYADNFYVMQLIDDSVEASLKDMAENQNILQEQLQLEEGFRVVVKCGNVIDCGSEEKPLSVKDMISKAGYARRAKQESMVENFSVFDNEIRKQREAEERIENTIEKALEDNEFFVMFQPKVDLTTEKCVGAEALVRWQTKDNGVLNPDQFIPILEKNGYVTKVDFFVYRTVFMYIKRWLEEGLPMVPVSLNISRLSHDSTTFVTDFNNLFCQYGIPSNLVELEIEERFAGANDEAIKEMAQQLHESGYLVNMDDFGSGESSLNMLSEIPVDVIKFDQRFLHYAEVSESSKIILISMVKMVKDLGKKTICEGVETAAQVEILRSVHCDTAQGYYYSRPVSPEKFKEYLLSHI